MFDKATARAHVRQLVRELDLVWIRCEFDAAVAHLDSGIVEFAAVVDEKTYAMALHEIGHFASGSRYEPQLEQETQAWVWAKNNALFWTRKMKALMQECLEHYLISRRTKPMPAGHLIYELSKISHALIVKWRCSSCHQ